MTDPPHLDAIRARYGDVDTSSGPVDPLHPTFDSLLGALRAVYRGEADRELLVRYHDVLGAQLEESRRAAEAEPATPETADRRRVTLASLDIVRIMLDALGRYLQHPTAETLTHTVDLLLHSQRIVRAARAWLEADGQPPAGA